MCVFFYVLIVVMLYNDILCVICYMFDFGDVKVVEIVKLVDLVYLLEKEDV